MLVFGMCIYPRGSKRKNMYRSTGDPKACAGCSRSVQVIAEREAGKAAERGANKPGG